MKHTLFIGLSLLTCLTAGCAKTSFTHSPLVKLNDPNPAAIVSQWSGKQPPTFTTENAFVIHIPFHDDLAFLGIVQIDRPAKTFEFVALTPTGVQIFHVNGDASGNHVRDAIEPLMKRKNILLSFAEDIRRMYLDVTPDASSKPGMHSKHVTFAQKDDAGKTVFDFGGDPIVLREKRVKGFLRTKWKAEYFDYATQDGKTYPRGIEMKNGRYFYRITVKNRSFDASAGE